MTGQDAIALLKLIMVLGKGVRGGTEGHTADAMNDDICRKANTSGQEQWNDASSPLVYEPGELRRRRTPYGDTEVVHRNRHSITFGSGLVGSGDGSHG